MNLQDTYNLLVNEKLPLSKLEATLDYLGINDNAISTNDKYTQLFIALNTQGIRYTGKGVPKHGPKPFNCDNAPPGYKNRWSHIRKLSPEVHKAMLDVIGNGRYQTYEYKPEPHIEKALYLAGFWDNGRFTKAAYFHIRKVHNHNYQETYNKLVNELLQPYELFRVLQWLEISGKVQIDMNRASLEEKYAELFRILRHGMQYNYTGKGIPKHGPKPLNYDNAPSGMRNCSKAIKKLPPELLANMLAIIGNGRHQTQEYTPSPEQAQSLYKAGFWYDGRFTKVAYEYATKTQTISTAVD